MVKKIGGREQEDDDYHFCRWLFFSDYVLIKKTEEYGYVAHCLELDLVATEDTHEAVEAGIFDVIVARVRYAFANDNLEYLYHPAPAEVWKEFYECRDQVPCPDIRPPCSGEPSRSYSL